MWIEAYHTRYVERSPYVSKKAGHCLKVYECNNDLVIDFFHNMGIDPCCVNKNLLETIICARDDEPWCRDKRIEPKKEWSDFVSIITTKARYYFKEACQRNNQSSGVSPSDNTYFSFENLSSLILKYQKNFILPFKKNHPIFRARAFKEPQGSYNVKNLGPPLSENISSVSSRMSAAGIPMFYGSLDRTACEDEIRDIGKKDKSKYEVLVIGKFSLLKDVLLLDMTWLPPLPHAFSTTITEFEEIAFLHNFSTEISKLIKKDGREHIEYIPSQIFTEYIRYVFKFDGKSIDGIIYPSSATYYRYKNIVLFIEQENCIDSNSKNKDSPSEKVLQLIDTEEKRY